MCVIQKIFICSTYIAKARFKSFVARGDFCPPLITFANGLDPDQDR